MAKACNNPQCSVSTGIHEGLTFGSGRLDHNGYFEFPCAPCARAYEEKHPEDGECWPGKDQDIAELSALVKARCDKDDKEFVVAFSGLFQ